MNELEVLAAILAAADDPEDGKQVLAFVQSDEGKAFVAELASEEPPPAAA